MIDELWSVRLPDGNVKQATLDQIDEAFNSGLIPVDAHVKAPGESEWTRLGDVLGAETAVGAPAPASTRPVMVVPAQSTQQLVSDLDIEIEAARARGSSNKKRLVVGGAGVALVAAIAIAASAGGSASADASKAAAAAPPAPPAERLAMPTATQPPEDPAARFTEEQKKKLQQLDAQNEAKAQKVKSERAKNAPRPHHDAQPSPVYMGGGGKGDPLSSVIH